MSNTAAPTLTAENITSATLVDVVDTREIEWINDKPRRARGTGRMVECAICGKGAEVHTIVRLAGVEFVVGGSCAKLIAGGGVVRSVSVDMPVKLAAGNGWSYYSDGSVRGVNAEHPKVVALIARNFG